MWTVKRRYSNGCEESPGIYRDNSWVLDAVGSPRHGHKSVEMAQDVCNTMNRAERIGEAIEELDKLADLLADSEDLLVKQTPVVETLNKIIGIMNGD